MKSFIAIAGLAALTQALPAGTSHEMQAHATTTSLSYPHPKPINRHPISILEKPSSSSPTLHARSKPIEYEEPLVTYSHLEKRVWYPPVGTGVDWVCNPEDLVLKRSSLSTKLDARGMPIETDGTLEKRTSPTPPAFWTCKAPMPKPSSSSTKHHARGLPVETGSHNDEHDGKRTRIGMLDLTADPQPEWNRDDVPNPLAIDPVYPPGYPPVDPPGHPQAKPSINPYIEPQPFGPIGPPPVWRPTDPVPSLTIRPSEGLRDDPILPIPEGLTATKQEAANMAVETDGNVKHFKHAKKILSLPIPHMAASLANQEDDKIASVEGILDGPPVDGPDNICKRGRCATTKVNDKNVMTDDTKKATEGHDVPDAERHYRDCLLGRNCYSKQQRRAIVAAAATDALVEKRHPEPCPPYGPCWVLKQQQRRQTKRDTNIVPVGRMNTTSPCGPAAFACLSKEQQQEQAQQEKRDITAIRSEKIVTANNVNNNEEIRCPGGNCINELEIQDRKRIEDGDDPAVDIQDLKDFANPCPYCFKEGKEEAQGEQEKT